MHTDQHRLKICVHRRLIHSGGLDVSSMAIVIAMGCIMGLFPEGMDAGKMAQSGTTM
jgi:hypothetical protein